ncbi:MAG: Asp-tRNA(Asn)/Glu-tRNA(Gln) amidotransferase subunit GatC [Clostridiales bacterium]|nr:Asp-tRNA(Asn)/Glu-tRNA(Gln) amidotransferase subunit GatC [Clostridiales bacterium]
MLIQLAELNKLSLSEVEIKAIDKYESISMACFESLEKVNAEGREPMVYNYSMVNVFRDDMEVKKFSRDQILSNAPEQYEGAFQVPRIVE